MVTAHSVYCMDCINLNPVGIETPVSSTAYATTAEQAYQPQGQIHATEIRRTEMYVPENYGQKPFEYWTSITDPASDAYRILHGAKTFENDGTITIDGYTAVAMSQKYGRPGDRFSILLTSGKWMHVIIADAKRTYDTDGYVAKSNRHIIEMIVWNVPSKARGTLCYGELPQYSGEVTKIYKET